MGSLYGRAVPGSRVDTARKALIPLGVFAAARLAQIVLAYFVMMLDRSLELAAVLTRWDGYWYVEVAREGYPSQVLEGHGNGAQSNLGFFPVFPFLIRVVRAVTPFDLRESAVIVSVISGAAAFVVLWFLIRRLTDEGTATRSIVLLAFAPSAFVLGMGYSEALLLLLAGVCLWALVAERWLLAGIAAAIASASRPNGFVLAACCAWAAIAAYRRTKSFKPFIAPALAPLGLIAFFAMLQVRAGDFGAYIKTQHRGWNQGFDAGAHTFTTLMKVFAHPLRDFNLLCSLLAVIVVIICAVLMVKWRPPFIFVIFTVGILGLALTSTSLTSTPRFVMTAFPLTVALARKIEGAVFLAIVGVSASLMAGLFILSSLSIFYAP